MPQVTFCPTSRTTSREYRPMSDFGSRPWIGVRLYSLTSAKPRRGNWTHRPSEVRHLTSKINLPLSDSDGGLFWKNVRHLTWTCVWCRKEIFCRRRPTNIWCQRFVCKYSDLDLTSDIESDISDVVYANGSTSDNLTSASRTKMLLGNPNFWLQVTILLKCKREFLNKSA